MTKIINIRILVVTGTMQRPSALDSTPDQKPMSTEFSLRTVLSTVRSTDKLFHLCWKTLPSRGLPDINFVACSGVALIREQAFEKHRNQRYRSRRMRLSYKIQARLKSTHCRYQSRTTIGSRNGKW